MPPVLISLTAFGAAEVGRHGQPWFARLATEAGADAVEVRGELLREDGLHDELALLAPFTAVYSEPLVLWTEEGELDTGALERGITRAKHLGAPRLKMSIGGYGPASAGTFAQLAGALEGRGVELVIENDQTVAAGSLAAIGAFFADAQAAGTPLGMTFDLGNWHWVGECPMEAARTVGQRVTYVHTKGVQRLPAKWVAVPLADSAAPWRPALRMLPRGLPWAIEYPLMGDDLLAVARREIAQLREVSATLGAPL